MEEIDLKFKSEKKYFCDFCNAIFAKKTDISQHIDIHRKHSILHCKVCGLKFTTAKILKAHLKGHFEPKICEFCAKAFARSVELKLHIASKHICELKFSCTFCSRRFTTKKIQREHETRVHRTIKKTAYECLECKQTFPLREKLRVHSFEHYFGQVYKCTEDCDKLFKTSQALKLHMRSHSKEKTYRCHRCTKTFVQSSGLGKHLKQCNRDVKHDLKGELDESEVKKVASAQYQELLKVKGRICRNSSVVKLKKKIEDVSRKEQTIKIENLDGYKSDIESEGYEANISERESYLESYQFQCELTFNSKPGVSLHLRPQNLIRDKNMEKLNQTSELCHFCAKTFKTKLKRQLHEKSSHQQQPVECHLCKKRLKHQVCLKEHMRNFHQPEFKRRKPAQVECSRCLKIFYGKSKLDRHVKFVHEKVCNGKEYRCQKCYAMFRRKNDLREHSFIHVQSDRDIFSCLICGQQFFTIAKLKFHNFTHNPQQVCCTICQKVFARQASLRKHQKTCHLVRSNVFVSQS